MHRFGTPNFGSSLKDRALSPFLRLVLGHFPRPVTRAEPGLGLPPNTAEAPAGKPGLEAALLQLTCPGAEKPRPGSRPPGSLALAVRLRRAVTASRLPPTRFGEPQLCPAEARGSTRSPSSSAAWVPAPETMGLPWERNASGLLRARAPEPGDRGALPVRGL